MSYTTLNLLRQRLDPQILAGLADDINTPPTLEDAQSIAVVNKAIADGAALIDSILGAQVDLAGLMAGAGDSLPDPDWLPQTAAQRALERLGATLALYFLFQRRCLDEGLNPLSTARELAEAHLRAVVAGREQLGGSLSSPPQKTAWSSTQGREPQLSRTKLRRF